MSHILSLIFFLWNNHDIVWFIKNENPIERTKNSDSYHLTSISQNSHKLMILKAFSTCLMEEK